MRKGTVKTLALVAVTALVVSALVGCGNQSSSSSEPQYADGEFIQSVAKGFEARSALIEKAKPSDASSNYYESLVAAELKEVEGYQSAAFEDGKLQEYAISYINALKDQKEAASFYSSDNEKYQEDWSKAYDKRSTLLQVFVENYGLSVSSSCQDALNDLVSHGKKVTRDANEKNAIEALANSIDLELTKEYSHYMGKATVTNSTEYDFDSISFNVEVFDSSNVKIDAATMYANHWLAGETIVLDCYISPANGGEPETLKIVPSYYTIAK